jgi:ribosomal protein L33
LFVNQSEKIIKTYEKINSSSHDKIGVLSQRYHNLMNQFESLKRFIEHNNKQKETDRLEMKKFREEVCSHMTRMFLS